MLDPVRENFVKDGVVMQVWQFDPAWTRSRKMVYEVMRVIGGKPLFFDDHLERMLSSASMAWKGSKADAGRSRDDILKLIDHNPKDNGNILFSLIPGNGRLHHLAWYVEHHYPSQEDYLNGVMVRTMKGIRHQPNAKVWNAPLRSKASLLLKSSGAYEMLLVDRHRNVTECSRSNIFLVRGEALFTPPESEVLQGITRKKVFDLCRTLKITITEKTIPLQELPFYEAVFITGTSRGVLPVIMIDNHRFNVSNKIIKRLMTAYNTLVEEAVISIC